MRPPPQCSAGTVGELAETGAFRRSPGCSGASVFKEFGAASPWASPPFWRRTRTLVPPQQTAAPRLLSTLQTKRRNSNSASSTAPLSTPTALAPSACVTAPASWRSCSPCGPSRRPCRAPPRPDGDGPPAYRRAHDRADSPGISPAHRVPPTRIHASSPRDPS